MGGSNSTVKVSYLGDAKSLARASKQASEEVNKVGAATSGVSKKSALMAGVGVAAVTKFAKSATDKFSEVGRESVKLQRYIGGNIEDASRLRYAASQSGVGVDDLAVGLGKLSKSLVGATDKTKTITSKVAVATGEWRKHTAIVKDAAGHFKKIETMVPVTRMESLTRVVKVTNPLIAQLGIKVKDAAGHIRPMGDLLPEIAEKFKSMPAGADKTALALKLFGKAGMGLMPFLNKGADGIKELQKESDKFGNTLNSKDAAALKANTVAKRKWGAALTGLQIQLGRNLLPLMTRTTQALQMMSQFISRNGAVIKPLIAGLGLLAIVTFTINKAMAAGRAIQSAYLAVKAIFVTTTNAETGAVTLSGLAQLRAKAATVASTIATVAANVATKAYVAGVLLMNAVLGANPIMLVVLGLVALAAGIIYAYKHSETFRTIVQATFAGVKAAFDVCWTAIKTGFAWLQGHWKLVLSILTGPIGTAAIFIATHWSQIKKGAEGLVTGLKTVFAKVTDFILAPFKAAFNGISAAWNNTAGQLSFKVPGWVPGIGGDGFSMPKIPTYANGGNFRAGLALVGERGPELVSMGGSGHVSTARETRSMLGGSTQPVSVNLVLDGQVIHTALLRLKRTRGGGLGLA
jgi:hypothetical protein